MDAKLDGALERSDWIKRSKPSRLQKYAVIWLTGQSGAGKTALAEALEIPAIRLDGDEMRDSISTDLGFSLRDRIVQNIRVACLAAKLSKQAPVIVSVIAPTGDIRAAVDFYCEPIWVYVKRTLAQREEHIYEEPRGYFTVDHDTFSVDESSILLKRYLLENSPTQSCHMAGICH